MNITGILIVLASTIGYSAIYPLLKKASEKIPPFSLVALNSLVVMLIAVVLSLMFEKNAFSKTLGDKNHLGFVVVAGLVNLIAFWLATLAFKYMPIWQQNLFMLLVPVLSGVFAFFLLKEAISTKLFMGLAIMAIGLFIAVR